MVLPAILGAYFVIDLVVMFATGEDIIQHLTGIDIYAPIVDPIVNFLLPDTGGGNSAQDIIDNQDAWGVALMDGMSMIFTALIIIAVLVFLLMMSKRKNGGS